jgi:hypothetical protein
MQAMKNTIPEITFRNRMPSIHLQRLIGLRYAVQHRVVILSETSDRIELATRDTSLAMMDEIRKAIPQKKEVVFFKADPGELETAMKRLYEPFTLSRYF